MPLNENWSEPAIRPLAVKAACSEIVGALPELVKMQFICAAGTMFAAGIVTDEPAIVANVPVFPVIAELASLHVAVAKVKVELAVSVICTAVLNVDTVLAAGVVGVGVPTLAVVMAAGVEAKFVTANVNGPPIPPVVVF